MKNIFCVLFDLCVLTFVLFFLSCENKNISEEKLIDSSFESSEINETTYLDWVNLGDISGFTREELMKLDSENRNLNVGIDVLEQSFANYSSKYSTVIIDSLKYYIVEGDLLFDEDELYIYYMAADNNLSAKRLIGIIYDDEVSRWPPDYTITYSIIESSFSDDEYISIKDSFKKAADDWTSICNVKFEHVEDLDNTLALDANPDNLSFVVRKIDSNRLFLALAFFPHQPKQRKKIYIDPTYFQTRYDKVGVLRHELGHVLGFLHEHIRSGAPAICSTLYGIEDPVGIPFKITDYDPKSVMHYFCSEGFGTFALDFTDVDRIGAADLYGPPL